MPTEFKWEVSARQTSVVGNLVESMLWQTTAARFGEKLFYGDVREWTSSPYSPYPGFKPLAGTLGGYNGKFMCN